MTRKLKFITILAAGTSVTATGLGVGLGVGLKDSSSTNVEWYENGSLIKEQSHFKKQNLIKIIETVFKYDQNNQTWLYKNQKTIPFVYIDDSVYTIVTPKKIMDNTGKSISMPSVKNKNIKIMFSLVTDVPEPPATEHTYTLNIDNKQVKETSEEDITYLELFQRVGITYDSETDNWIKSDNGQITYYSISNGKSLLPSQRNEIASNGIYLITSHSEQVHNATMIMMDVEQLPQTTIWYGDETYEELFKNAISFFGIHIVAEDGKWVSHDQGIDMTWVIKFNDEDNGPEILATNKDGNAQNGIYYFDMVL